MRKFRNFKLHTKFVWSFIVVALMSFLIGLASILSLMNMRKSDEQMYQENTKPMADLIVMYDLLSAQRICAGNMVTYLESDPEFSSAEAHDLGNKETDFEAAFSHFKTSLKEAEELTAYNEASSLYYGTFKNAKQALHDAYAAGDHTAMVAALREIDDLGAAISDAMDNSMNFNETYAAAKVAANQELYKISVITVCVIVFVALLIALFEARFLTKLIVDPIKRLLQATKQVGEAGDFRFQEEAVEAAKRDAQYKDEIGQTMASFSVMMDSIIAKVQLLGDIANGDLSVKAPKVSEADTMGNALEQMLNSLNEMFDGIRLACAQVTTGSNQIATGAQQLAQATSEQASTVDLLSRSVGDVTEKTQANTALAEQAASLGGAIKQNAEQGSEQMTRMTKAVYEINEASQSISTVIKVIDDIAFQTNILALNAAVEAARAGEAGKGFAVVADEVRNLAGKSAQAAKNTSALIEDSVQKAELGARIAKETSGALEHIVSGINESTAIVARMASASAEQLIAIQEINSAIDQVTGVVQQNSATAEQSAAASEEMNNQAAVLSDLINHFKLRK